MVTLDSLSLGSIVRIKGYTKDTPLTQRLREMGLTTGTTMTIVRRAPFNGPFELSFGQTRIALRLNSFNDILLEVLS